MLSLSKIQQRHHGCLFVLWRITFEDLIDELVVLIRELEGDAGIVLGGVSMLNRSCQKLQGRYCGVWSRRGNSQHEAHRWQLWSWP
jgi:Txe/YoeB family toxin of Txe-Axe toxin-antitoxin module